METSRRVIIQGDVMLWPVDSIPDGAEQAPGDRHVLAYGERTGHAHVLHGAALWTADGERYVQAVADAEAVLRHEDHGPDVPDALPYRVIQQVEHDPMGGFRAVAD